MTPSERIAAIQAKHGPQYRKLLRAEHEAEDLWFVQNQGTGRDYDRALEARCDYVYTLTSEIPDSEIEAVWTALSDAARAFGEDQGDEESGGRREVLAWALAYVCECEAPEGTREAEIDAVIAARRAPEIEIRTILGARMGASESDALNTIRMLDNEEGDLMRAALVLVRAAKGG